jgi:hypothetical protein
VRRNAVLAVLLALLLMGAHSLVFRGAASYLDQLRSPWRALPHNLMVYTWGIRHSFFGIEGTVPGLLLLLATVALGGAGLLIRLRRGVALPEVFTLSYGLLVLLWTSDNELRLLIPLLPMWAYYVAVALQSLPGRARRLAAPALLSILLIGYAARYTVLDTSPIGDGLGNPAFAGISSYIRTETAPEAVFVFQKARLLALTTGRNVSPYHRPASGVELLHYFKSISARYVLVNREFPYDAGYLEPLLVRDPTQAHEIRVEGPFHLYALR